MAEEKVNDLTDKDLVELAGSTVVGTPSGSKAQYAQAELTRRLMVSINSLNKESSRYSDKLLELSVLMFILAFVQVLVALFSVSASWMEKGLLIVAFVFLMVRIFKDIEATRDQRINNK